MESLIRQGKRWILAPSADCQLVNQIQTSLSCGRPFASLLAQRGGNDWQKLINPNIEDFHSPFLMLAMKEAVSRLMRAIEHKEHIFIHGDFDVDGLTGAAVLYRGLLPLLPKGSLKVDVGDRERGHGLSQRFVQRVIDEEFSLVVTVDCGSSDKEQIDLLNNAGIDTIVTDHHLLPTELPPAIAILNPHQEEDTYPNTHLAGVGVAYKLICGLYIKMQINSPYELLDLVALGTIADLVPLADKHEVENRAIVQEGFSLVAQGKGSSLGFQELVKKLSVNENKLTASDIGYILAPKLNAANRSGDPKVAFLLLTTNDRDRAEYLIEILLDYNRDRGIAQTDLLAQARGIIARQDINPEDDGIVILSGKYWNEGILGLTASNMADRYGVPAVIISKGDRVSRGSCRSVQGFDIASCLETNSNLLIQHGGHKMAAGFTVSNNLLPQLRNRLLQCAAKYSGKISDTEHLDEEVGSSDVDIRLYTNLRSLAPYGPGNPAPRFLLKDCMFDELSLVGARKRHIKGTISHNGECLPFIAFQMGKHLDVFEESSKVAVVFRAGFDDWRSKVQLEIVDLVAC